LVAKRLNSVYESGWRSGAWVKVKLTRVQEFVIGGYTLPEGSRKYFGSLLVGYHGPDGLLFAGRVGTGFSDKVLANIDAQLQKLRRTTCPFTSNATLNARLLCLNQFYRNKSGKSES
jgi:bifunctional non-homologous end joining protein LigD